MVLCGVYMCADLGGGVIYCCGPYGSGVAAMA